MTADQLREMAEEIDHTVLQQVSNRGLVPGYVRDLVLAAVTEALEEVQPYIVAMSDPMRESGRKVEYLEGWVCQLRAALDEIERQTRHAALDFPDDDRHCCKYRERLKHVRAIIAKTREGAGK